ncbi:MAG: (Fe-S)-binding protein [Alphaproteobacteria bacterium]|nr:(Fe-S)-binding protein [Alphaproteobacteria bacterium]
MAERPPNVALFVTCLVDLFRPGVGFAAVKLLEDAGCTVHVPPVQTCCGQPGYNAGARSAARQIAAQVIEAFVGYDWVVAPSGSCAGMIRYHYPALFRHDPILAGRAGDLAERTYELTSFLTDVLGVERVEARFEGAVTYHDSCSSLREMGVSEQPRKLLASVAGLELAELAEAESCCGFGGAFAVKYGEISLEIAARKAAHVVESGAGTLLGGDLGCLLNLAGKLARDGSPVRVRHVAEVLAGMAERPAIGEPATASRAADGEAPR